MRYIFISDVHGQFDKMISALNEVKFDKDKDTLVSLGDLFDRGPDSWEVLNYVMSCPNRILIWGNHDLRLRDLLLGSSYSYSYDYSNGVLETIKSFCSRDTLTSISLGINIFSMDDNYKDRYKLLWQYFDECRFAIEFKDLVGTHAWIPAAVDYNKTSFDKWGNPTSEIVYRYYEDWRNADRKLWADVTWCNSQDMFNSKVFIPNKKLIVGHWHAWRFRAIFLTGEVTYRHQEDIDFNTFEYEDKFVAIDGCSNLKYGKVNAWIYETDEEPMFI